MSVRFELDRRTLAGGLIPLAALLFLSACMLLLVASPAHAFPVAVDNTEPFSLWTCDQCHATSGEGTAWDGSGPHAGYMTTTNKCVLCHDVHGAPAASVKLLRGPTVSQTCLMCHDGTSSKIGPYHSITQNGGTVVGEHAYEFTNVIPGGSANLAGVLSCADCHSVHGASTVTPFVRDSTRAFVAADSGALVTSDCLLRSNINGKTVATYGALWCSACHDQRHSTNGSSVKNHPVGNVWSYNNLITTVSGISLRNPNYSTSPDLAIGMGQTNAGYIMAPVAEVGDGRVQLGDRQPPMCQQCHEDARNVEAIFEADAYSPGGATDNPRYLTFPHQTTSPNLLGETNDDLCLNCHDVSLLP